MTPPIVDLARLSENDRIALLLRHVAQGQTVAFIVETDEKADRYVRKLGPGVRVVWRGPGLARGTIMVKIGPTLQ
jgi:hypothetical protein